MTRTNTLYTQFFFSVIRLVELYLVHSIVELHMVCDELRKAACDNSKAQGVAGV